MTDVLCFRIKRRECADGADQNPHGVGVVAEALDKVFHVLVHNGVHFEIVFPHREMSWGREFSLHDQIGRFEIGRFFRYLLDRVSAVPQDALLAVDITDGTAAGGRVGQRRVETDQTGTVVVQANLGQVGGLNGILVDRELKLLASSIVCNGKGIGHPNLLHA